MSASAELRTTDSALVRRTVEEAERLGLVVELKREDRYSLETVSVIVKRPHAEPVTMLDVVRNADALHVYALRGDLSGSRRWSHSSWRHGYTCTTKLGKLRFIPYHLAGMAER